MDSATAAAVALDQGFEVYALSFRYGQRHAAELEAARRVARAAGLRRHVVLDIDLRAFGGSALTGDLEVPKDTPLERIGTSIPATYVPARNTIFLSFALGLGRDPRRLATSSSAPTRSTTAATPIAGRSTSRPSSAWRTSRPGPASKVAGSGSTPR